MSHKFSEISEYVISAMSDVLVDVDHELNSARFWARFWRSQFFSSDEVNLFNLDEPEWLRDSGEDAE